MNQHAKFYALIKQMPYANKTDLVSTYSKGKTASLRDFYKLDPKGYEIMLSDMVKCVANGKNTPQPSPKATDSGTEKRRFRSLILRAMQDQGVMVVNRDWSPVNEFVARYAGDGKSLNNMSLDELKKFNKQVHKLLEWHKAQIEKRIKQALLN